MRRHKLAVIPGDGIGPEVVEVALRVLDAVEETERFATERTEYDLGARRLHRTGEVLDDATLARLRGADAILLGAIGSPDAPAGLLERDLLLRLRFELDLYVNLRPVRLFEGVASPIAGLTPAVCDMVVVRENTESLYAGAGGVAHRGTAAEVATQESLNTRHAVERAVEYAFSLARGRPARTVTLVHKTNVLAYAGDLWQRVFDEVGERFPEVERRYVHVDAACLFMVTDPGRFDVVVTDNLFGDIITDLGAAIQGGMGLAASANLDPGRRSPSMFEPIHGSAPDIAGTGVADPVGAVLSLALMLDFLGEADAARRVTTAVEEHLRDPSAAPLRTEAVGDRLVDALQAAMRPS